MLYFADKDHANMEIVLGAGSISGDTLGALRDLTGITEEFYSRVYKNTMNKVCY